MPHDVTIPRMANLDEILKELQQERDRLDKAFAALNGTTPNSSQIRSLSLAFHLRHAGEWLRLSVLGSAEENAGN